MGKWELEKIYLSRDKDSLNAENSQTRDLRSLLEHNYEPFAVTICSNKITGEQEGEIIWLKRMSVSIF